MELKVLTPDDWREWRELRLLALTEAPYAFGSTLADWQGEHDTEARWRGRLTEVPFNVHAAEGGVALGQVSAYVTDDSEVVELISMYVAPSARGTGAGAALVQAVLQWARSRGANAVTLGVTSGNERAVALYARCGFVDDPGRSRERCEISMVQRLRAG